MKVAHPNSFLYPQQAQKVHCYAQLALNYTKMGIADATFCVTLKFRRNGKYRLRPFHSRELRRSSIKRPYLDVNILILLKYITSRQ